MALVTASEFLRSKGYEHSQLSKGPKNVLMALNKHGIEIVKTVAVARGISFLIDEEKADSAYELSMRETKKSDGGAESKMLHRQDRSLARAILAIANELGIKLNNNETIIDIAEYGDK